MDENKFVRVSVNKSSSVSDFDEYLVFTHNYNMDKQNNNKN